MSKRSDDYAAHRAYIEAEGLDQLIDFSQGADWEEGTFDMVRGPDAPLPPEPADLVRLHQLVRQRKSFTVMEFGIGYSTLIFADALAKNEAEWNALDPVPEVRNRFLFQLFSVDADEKWIETTRERFPDHLRDRVHFHASGVEIGTWQGQLCHYYETLPDVVPDFVYLDGPAPKDVKGSVRGLTFQCDERTVMAADLLLMEPTLLPGTFILVDGRTNNARFLQHNFRRPFEYQHLPEHDQSTFELNEPRLGKYNVLGTDFLR